MLPLSLLSTASTVWCKLGWLLNTRAVIKIALCRNSRFDAAEISIQRGPSFLVCSGELSRSRNYRSTPQLGPQHFTFQDGGAICARGNVALPHSTPTVIKLHLCAG